MCSQQHWVCQLESSCPALTLTDPLGEPCVQDQLLPDLQQPRFVHNASGRFESRWVTVRIEDDSPAVMLKVGRRRAPAARAQEVPLYLLPSICSCP